MNNVRITVESEGFFSGFTVIIGVPKNVDEEEYIDDVLESVFKEEVWENTIWDFD